jgi:hypothetical protein
MVKNILFCFFHRKRVVERLQHRGRITKIRARRECGSAQHVDDGDGEQRRADAVAADIQQVDGEMIVVDAVVAEGIAAELGGGHQQPVGRGRFGALVGQDGEDVAAGIVQLFVEPRLRALQEQVLLGQLVLDGLAMFDHGLVEQLQIVVFCLQLCEIEAQPGEFRGVAHP